MVVDERHVSKFIFLCYVVLYTGEFSVCLASFSCDAIVIEYINLR